MKKFLYCILFVMMIVNLSSSPGAASVKIDSANFPDNNFRNFVLEALDPNHDGTLTNKEIAQIREFWVVEIGRAHV